LCSLHLGINVTGIRLGPRDLEGNPLGRLIWDLQTRLRVLRTAVAVGEEEEEGEVLLFFRKASLTNSCSGRHGHIESTTFHR
jgi:hypothetical protein